MSNHNPVYPSYLPCYKLIQSACLQSALALGNNIQKISWKLSNKGIVEYGLPE